MTENDGAANAGIEDLRLAVEVQQLAINRLSNELGQVADQAAEGITTLREQLDAVSAVGGSGRRAPVCRWCWRDMDSDAASRLIDELAEWLDWLRDRYPLGDAIPTCWREHPEMVEEITAAYVAWTTSYRDPDASPYGPAEWHERWLPGLEHRLTHRWKARRCEAGHQPRSRGGLAQQVQDPDRGKQAS